MWRRGVAGSAWRARRVAASRGACALAAAAAVGWTACAALVKPPDVLVEKVYVERITFDGGRLVLHLDLRNPNNFELRGLAVEYTLDVAESGARDPRWVRVGSGVRDEPFAVAPLRSATVEVPLDFTWSGVGAAVRAWLADRRVDVRAEGAVRVRTPTGTVRVPFRKVAKLVG